jgi:hypothetical protein
MRHLRLLLLALALCSAPSTVQARAKGEVSYPFNSVWTTLVRLVRVDLGCAITEKDKDEGYVIFDYEDAGRTVPGTIELVRSKRGVQEVISLVVQIPAMPSYVERMVIDRLERKLREELGSPRQAPAAAPPTTPPATPTPAEGAATAAPATPEASSESAREDD